MKYFETRYDTAQIPTFEQIRNPPKNFSEGAWVVGMISFCFILWIIKGLVNNRLVIIKEQFEARLKEDTLQLQQQDAMIRFLMAQNDTLIKERSEMISTVTRLSRACLIPQNRLQKMMDTLSTDQPEA